MDRSLSPSAAPPHDGRATASADFDGFYRSSWPGAVRSARLLTQDASVADEIAQEAFASVLRRWDLIVEPHAYLYRCLVNGSRMYHRRSGVVRAKLPLLGGNTTDEQLARFGELTDAVARLPFRQRAVLVLRYHCDLSERDIAEALDVRPGTVKSLASRALATLQEELRP